MRTVSVATGSAAPTIGTVVVGAVRSFDVIWIDAVWVPVFDGSNATSTVHRSPAAIVADAAPHGFEPPSSLSEKLGDAPAARTML
jgi:hypothetical protein